MLERPDAAILVRPLHVDCAQFIRHETRRSFRSLSPLPPTTPTPTPTPSVIGSRYRARIASIRSAGHGAPISVPVHPCQPSQTADCRLQTANCKLHHDITTNGLLHQLDVMCRSRLDKTSASLLFTWCRVITLVSHQHAFRRAAGDVARRALDALIIARHSFGTPRYATLGI